MSSQSGTSGLPGNLRQETVGICANRELAELFEDEHANAERDGQEVVLDRYTTSEERLLDTGNIREEDGDDESNRHGREQVVVARQPVANGWVLEDAEASGPLAKQVAPLHKDQVEEVDALQREKVPIQRQSDALSARNSKSCIISPVPDIELR